MAQAPLSAASRKFTLFRLQRGFACGKTRVRRKDADRQKAVGAVPPRVSAIYGFTRPFPKRPSKGLAFWKR